MMSQNNPASLYDEASHGAPRNAGADDDDDKEDLFSISTNLTLKSLKNRKKF
jgi:hypothetical protein